MSEAALRFDESTAEINRHVAKLNGMRGTGGSDVFGASYPDLGEAVVAVLTGDAGQAAVIGQAREHLASSKVPTGCRRSQHCPQYYGQDSEGSTLRDL